MNKNKLNFYIDILLAISGLIIIFIGVLLGFIIAKGHAAPDEAKYFLGLQRHSWGDIHFIFSLIFIGLLILHVILHWSKIKLWFKQYIGFSILPGAIIIVVLSALLLFISTKIVDPETYADHSRGWRQAIKLEPISPDKDNYQKSKKRIKGRGKGRGRGWNRNKSH